MRRGVGAEETRARLTAAEVSAGAQEAFCKAVRADHARDVAALEGQLNSNNADNAQKLGHSHEQMQLGVIFQHFVSAVSAFNEISGLRHKRLRLQLAYSRMLMCAF